MLAPGKVQKVRVLGVCGTGEKVTSLCWQRVPDTTQLPAWRAGSPGSESPAHPPANPRDSMAEPWGGAAGLAGGGEQQHVPAPTSSHPGPVSPTTPGFACARRSHTALGQWQTERLQGHPNIFQIWGFRPKLRPGLLQVTQPGADSEPVPGPRGPFQAFIQQPLQAPVGAQRARQT